jgi:hypothetical protein
MPNPPSFYHLGGVLHIEQLPLVDQDFNRDKPIPSASIPQVRSNFNWARLSCRPMHAKGCNGRPGAEVPGAENFMELEPSFFGYFFGGIEIIETKEPAWDSLIHT